MEPNDGQLLAIKKKTQNVMSWTFFSYSVYVYRDENYAKLFIEY